MLWLVRHASVELRLDEPAHAWPLTDEGLAAAEELARELPPVARVISSPEPKAVGTAEPIARTNDVRVELDERLREVERAASLPSYDEHRAAVRRYLEGEQVDGWEPRDDALRRARDAVERLDDAAVVSHGMLLSLLLGYSFEEWNRIALPDAVAWERS